MVVDCSFPPSLRPLLSGSAAAAQGSARRNWTLFARVHRLNMESLHSICAFKQINKSGLRSDRHQREVERGDAVDRGPPSLPRRWDVTPPTTDASRE